MGTSLLLFGCTRSQAGSSCSTRDQTYTSFTGRVWIFTTGLPGKSPFLRGRWYFTSHILSLTERQTQFCNDTETGSRTHSVLGKALCAP